ncbi:hypothetical protein [Spiribacter onubensis]|uniref:Cobalamin adenosyltransferase-like domain-containing protein n=1 Tax=Spiribacter onubensis TaxID=3122420 RepID=A0ABV3SB34_9GAMM
MIDSVMVAKDKGIERRIGMRRSSDLDEVCYPFIHESGPLCDFEVITDELCGNIGAAISGAPADCKDIREDLAVLQPLAFHLNGSLRGRLAVTEEDLDWAKQRLADYRDEAAGRAAGFVLPRGEMPVPFLNLSRSGAKKAIRQMVRIEESGHEGLMSCRVSATSSAIFSSR